MIDFRNALGSSLTSLGESPTPSQLDLLEQFNNIVYEVNSRTNLTRIKRVDSVYLHFLDSLYALEAIPPTEDQRLLDIGSGAGFPGIPLKIMRPDLEVTLMDSSRKKVEFLSYVLSELNLKGITTLHGKAEKLASRSELKSHFHYVTTRALSELDKSIQLALPFLMDRGTYIAYLGPNQRENLAHSKLSTFGMDVKDTLVKTLPENMGERHIMLLSKAQDALAKVG